MARAEHDEDPYRVLGLLRGADQRQIKAAHRRLAKRFHPDGSSGDEERFLAVQEAYLLLSDPARRREWDRRSSAHPVRAQDPPSPTPSRPATRRQGARAGVSSTGRGRSADATRRARPPGQRTRTWSAEHVPWWEEFTPKGRAEADADREPGGRARARPGPREARAGETMDFDVFDRSSGAAWSMAARRHFRRGDAELPSRGAWRYRGTQVVTGAEARAVAAEEAATEEAPTAASEDPPSHAAPDPPP